MTLSRADGYIGVLVDDLVMKGVNEPCEFFLSSMELSLTRQQIVCSPVDPNTA